MEQVCGRCGTPVEGVSEFCPQCGARQRASADVPSAGRGRTPSRWRWITLTGAVAIVAAGIGTYLGDAFRAYHPVIATQPEVGGSVAPGGRVTSTMVTARIVGPMIIVSLDDVRRYRIVRFADPEGVQSVPAIAYLTPSGRLVTAMSLSESCRSDDFSLEGENIHCARCPSYWNASSMEAYACCQKYYPEPIPSTVLGDEVRIEASVMRGWKARS